MSQALTDTSPMPWGKYKGTPMEEIPAWYLLLMRDKATGPVKDYIEENIDVIEFEKTGKQPGR